MKILLTALLFFLSHSAMASKPTNIQSEKRPAEVSPQYITHFSDVSYEDTYVSTVSSLIGGAWLAQEVYVSIGFQEQEAIETYSFTVMGEILSVNYSRVDSDALLVQVKTSYGSFNSETGDFNEGNTFYFLKVYKDTSSSNGFAVEGVLSIESLDIIEDL